MEGVIFIAQSLNCFVIFAVCTEEMMNQEFEILSKIISNRRTVKPARMNGKKISEKDIRALLQLADWAPTHGRTEPWRFIVFEEQALQDFSKKHADLYKEISDPEKFRQDKFEKLIQNGQQASHLIAVVMKRTGNSKISEAEESAAVAAAIQNILLGAEALGIAAIWSTGGMATKEEMKPLLQLAPEDKVGGFLYLGYTEAAISPGFRKIPLKEKTYWKS